MPAPAITLRPGDAADIPRLVVVWRSSVDATHDFVLPEHLDYYEERMSDEYLPGVDLTVAEVDGEVVGFSGTDDHELAMLFVCSEYRGKGVGSALLEDALSRIPDLTLDVNEQNTQALGFYLKHGFRVAGRSPVDSASKPYPLLHLVHGHAGSVDTDTQSQT
jgi:putative acetyltransferase